MPAGFRAQAELVCRHLGTVLADADMTHADLVQMRFYLADPAYHPTNVEILAQYLGGIQSARTVLCARLLEPSWSNEVEAVAAVPS